MRTLAEMRPGGIVLANYPQGLAAADGSRIDDTEEWIQRWSSGLTATATRLKATGAALSILGDVPGLGKDPTECLLRRGATTCSCMFPISPLIERNNLATRRAAYIDDSHVSRTYGHRLAELLAMQLRLTSCRRTRRTR